MESMDFNKLLAGKRELVIIIATILIFCFISKKIYDRQMVEYASIKEQIAGEKEKSQAIERIVLLDKEVGKYKTKSWNTVDFNTIVEKIFNLGLEYHVKIRDIAPSEKRDERNYVAIPFSISGEVTYSDLLKFIKQLETFPMLIRVHSVNVNPIGSQDAEGELTLGMGVAAEAIYFK